MNEELICQEKSTELLDIKCLIRLNEVASSLIKMAPYDQVNGYRVSQNQSKKYCRLWTT